jgi:hypothetical protein
MIYVQYIGGKMAETKITQKNWRFTQQILSELEELCQLEMRSEQNMVEVLIHRDFEKKMRLQRVANLDRLDVKEDSDDPGNGE